MNQYIIWHCIKELTLIEEDIANLIVNNKKTRHRKEIIMNKKKRINNINFWWQNIKSLNSKNLEW